MQDAIWPLLDLAVITPVLQLRYTTDKLATALARLAADGIHDPATMPFAIPWTDAVSPELERNTLQYFWRTRADTSKTHWDLPLTVLVDGEAVGVCLIEADEFPRRRTAGTGSWLGRRYQGRGIGREMRAAALHLIFAGFDADFARTAAWHDNAASLAVTRGLPYTQTDTARQPRRGVPDTMLQFTMRRQQWNTVRRNDIQLVGIDAVGDQLGLSRQPAIS
ncbi:MAG: GNAT family protein [Mycobacterium sp.]